MRTFLSAICSTRNQIIYCLIATGLAGCGPSPAPTPAPTAPALTKPMLFAINGLDPEVFYSDYIFKTSGTCLVDMNYKFLSTGEEYTRKKDDVTDTYTKISVLLLDQHALEFIIDDISTETYAPNTYRTRKISENALHGFWYTLGDELHLFLDNKIELGTLYPADKNVLALKLSEVFVGRQLGDRVFRMTQASSNIAPLPELDPCLNK